jgi:hypothetical protein
MSWDIYACDDAASVGVGNECGVGIQPTARQVPAGASVGDADGKLENFEQPTVSANMWLDQTGLGGQAFFDVSLAMWSTGDDTNHDGMPERGLLSYPPAQSGINLGLGLGGVVGDEAGQIYFQIGSNVGGGTAGPALNLSAATGQPTDTGTGAVMAPFGATGDPPYTALQIADITGRGPVDYRDLVAPFGTGFADAQQDIWGKEPPSGGDGIICTADDVPNGEPDGVDCTPWPVTTFNTAMGLTPAYWTRLYGVANLRPAAQGPILSASDINFQTYNLVSLGLGFVTFTMVNYPFLPSGAPGDSNTVLNGPPFYASPVMTYGKTLKSPHTALGGGKPGLLILEPGEGTNIYDYREVKSSSDNFDGDAVSDYTMDTCKLFANTGDADGDGIDDACELYVYRKYDVTTNPTGVGPDHDVDTKTGFPVGGDWVATVGQPASVPWDGDQDVDGDTFMNRYDSCAMHPDSGAGGVYQVDSDSDGVGDLCDPSPLIKGNSYGYTGGSVTFDDNDNICLDQFDMGSQGAALSAEVAAEAWGVPSKLCLRNENNVPTVNPYANPAWTYGHIYAGMRDSNDDGTPDFVDLTAGFPYDMADTAADADGDGDTDACETISWAAGGVHPSAKSATDPLDPASNNYTGFDCDGGGILDDFETLLGMDFADPTDDAALIGAGGDADGDKLPNVLEALLGGCNYAKANTDLEQVDVIDGKVDVDESGGITTDGADDLADVKLYLSAGGTPDQVDIINGEIDVDEDGTVETGVADDDLANVNLYLTAGGSPDRVDIIDGQIDVDEDGTVETGVVDDDLANVALSGFVKDGLELALGQSCVNPNDDASDIDKDGCSNAEELGLNGTHTKGGQRSYLNPWDFIDPTADGAVSPADVTYLRDRYGSNSTWGPGTGPQKFDDKVDNDTIPDGLKGEDPIGDGLDNDGDTVADEDGGTTASGKSPYSPLVDRIVRGTDQAWDARAGDGALSPADVVAIRDQFGDSCIAAP